ncbi:hypothetical protein [Actinoallomurus vinaceus]|uniref:hypothetical protein n=1 Tax=Actinoallomurus vinaceus TaxID=1080074 RepID=UPI0031E7F43B
MAVPIPYPAVRSRSPRRTRRTTVPGARFGRVSRPRRERRPDAVPATKDPARTAVLRTLVAVIASAIVTTTVIATGAVWMPSARAGHVQTTGPARR